MNPIPSRAIYQLGSTSMCPDEKIVAPEQQTSTAADASGERVEPPKIYLPACGALVDIFWWARRAPEPPK